MLHNDMEALLASNLKAYVSVLNSIKESDYSPKSLQFHHSKFAILIFTRFSRGYIMLYSSCWGNYKRKENHILYSTMMTSGKVL